MFEGAISLIFDVLIVVLLCATIFYAIKLSSYLKSFRDGRGELEKLINDLSINIIKAENSVKQMKENSEIYGKDLQSVINKAKGASQELQIMCEVGDNLANRLEKASIASRSTKSPSQIKEKDIIKEVDSGEKKQSFDDEFSEFNIRDSEFDYSENDDDNNEWDGMDDLQSDAEKELFRALKNN